MNETNRHVHDETLLLPIWLQEPCTRLLQQDPELWNLNLNIRQLDSDQMTQLADALQQNCVLRILNLTSSLKQHRHALQPLANRVLPHHESLKILYLCYNNIKDVTGIATALRSNHTLEELYLHNNNLTCSSAEQLATSLQTNQALKVLHLGYNHIADKGCIALAQCLSNNSNNNNNTTLQSLSLHHNPITSVGMAVMEQALQKNFVIQHMDFCVNESDILSTRIALLCRANQMGRRQLLETTSFCLSSWMILLESINSDPDLLYFFLQSKPDLWCVQ